MTDEDLRERIRILQEEVRAGQVTLTAVVLASGGELSVTRRDIQDAQSATIEWFHEHDKTRYVAWVR
jgi:hypothetical protein